VRPPPRPSQTPSARVVAAVEGVENTETEQGGGPARATEKMYFQTAALESLFLVNWEFEKHRNFLSVTFYVKFDIESD